MGVYKPWPCGDYIVEGQAGIKIKTQAIFKTTVVSSRKDRHMEYQSMLKGSLIYSGGEGSAKAMLRKGKEMNLEYLQELNVGRTFKAERMACAKILG